MPRAVILTALPVEYLAVQKFLTGLRDVVHPLGTVYEQGIFAGDGFAWDVVIAQVGAGITKAAIAAERAISNFKPDVLLFVGIAGGLKDDVEIGDVVAATKVYGYESGKVTSEGFLTRPDAGQSAFALVERAKAEARKGDWLKRGEIAGEPKVVVGSIAAGDKVLADTDSEIFKLLRSAYNDAIAVEMEGYGFLSAVFAYPEIKAIVIRGISDMVEGKNDPEVGGKEKNRHQKASNHASAFAFELLAKFQPNGESNPITSEKIVESKINIGSSVQNSVVITGNSNVINYVFKNSLGQESEIRMPDRKTIRQLVEAALSNEDLSNLCQDDFPRVFKLFGENQSTGQRVRWLVDYVDKQNEIPKLLNAIQNLNPVVHSNFLSK
jgi:nucleoside phosphorylase